MALLATAGGCNRPRPEHTYLVAVEPPFWHAVTAAYPSLAADLDGTVLADGRRLQVLPVSAEAPRAELEAQLAGSRYAGVVLTPLLAFEAEGLAAAHPNVRFVLLTWASAGAAGAARGPPPANVTEVSFERTAARERAGRLTAAYLAGNPSAEVALLAASDSSRAAAGILAFRAGLAAAAYDRISERAFDPARGNDGLRNALEAAIGSAAAVVYLAVGDLTGEALRILSEWGRLAIVDNWGHRPGFEATVLLSVDDPALAAIEAGVEAPAGTRTAVPARVTWGLAAPLPDAAEGLYDGVRAAPADGGRSGRSPMRDDP